jgi:hypothetical protein
VQIEAEHDVGERRPALLLCCWMHDLTS